MDLDQELPLLPEYKVQSRVGILAETVDYAHKMMNIPYMWKDTMGEGIKIAVLDSGIPNHVDLKVQGSKSFIKNYSEDFNGHATHVGGIIAAVANNGLGISGIAPEVEDIYGGVLGRDGSGSISSIIRGIDWAVEQGANIINMSLGIPAGVGRVKELEKACNRAVDSGVTVICAAGNEAGGVGQPAIFDSVIAVAAVNSAKDHAWFSNVGSSVDFASAGVDVYSTYLKNGYSKLSGTSMAAPAISGVAALIMSRHLKRGKSILSPDEVRERIRKIAFDIGPEGLDDKFGHGIPIFGGGEVDHIESKKDESESTDNKGKKSLCSALGALGMGDTFIRAMSKKLEEGASSEEALKAASKAYETRSARVKALIKAGRL